MTDVLAGPEHLLAAGRRLQWDEAALDLRDDARAWRRLAPERRRAVRRLVAGFCVAEQAVAEHLVGFGDVADDPVVRACFTLQVGDEERHARWFGRVATEVVGLTEQEVRREAGAPLVALFEDELPRTARALADGAVGLAGAVALYHLVLEGLVFAVGQEALLHELERVGVLPTVRAGVARVTADERWHVGLGTLCLADRADDDAVPARTLAFALDAARAWGPAVATPERLALVARRHRRRLGEARLPAEPNASRAADGVVLGSGSTPTP